MRLSPGFRALFPNSSLQGASLPCCLPVLGHTCLPSPLSNKDLFYLNSGSPAQYAVNPSGSQRAPGLTVVFSPHPTLLSPKKVQLGPSLTDDTKVRRCPCHGDASSSTGQRVAKAKTSSTDSILGTGCGEGLRRLRDGSLSQAGGSDG